ncbi:hypothetical protein jhhlp_006997 [Lomentospora prolificans]|uniref:Uncharacterized protein n=1 Tax=Lomentospora prolificans TaxID=41688 RepID=A0A2N3N1F8_9PEZI|nr:hypothetical protein jhhlp_006997 [Lomentospora prolificans]
MKLTTVFAAAAAFTPASGDGSTEGGYYTKAGPGKPGDACFNIGNWNNKISSIRYYSDNPEHTSRCCVEFYDSPNCANLIGPGSQCRNFFADAKDLGINNDISSFKTRCFAIS